MKLKEKLQNFTLTFAWWDMWRHQLRWFPIFPLNLPFLGRFSSTYSVIVSNVFNYLCSRIIPYFQETLIHAQRFFGCGHEKRVWGEAVVRDTYARDMFHCSTELQTLIWMTTVWHSQREELFFKIRKLHSSSGGREQRTRLDVVACRAFIFIFECTVEVSVGLSCKYFFLLSGSFFFCSILSRNWQLKLDSLTNFSRVFISVDVSSGHWELGQLRGQEKWPT